MSENEKPQQAQPETHGEAVRMLAEAMFRTALWPSVATLVLCTVIFGVVKGTPGILGALVGGGIAAVLSLVTLLLMRKTAHHGPHVAMAASLGSFVGKMLILFVGVSLLRDVDALNANALGITMAAMVLVTAGAEAIAFRRTKLPTIIPAGEK